ncbi:hypothetical protein [Methanobacterium alcaliphilum]|uniref:hypothetical protein n=1 Tax=Methanobacterium alcaliphilum TaxID=392018 RepID=UPI00200AE750|nr:hypothetical protein [Methanobacterium alcaliphilum]MCK9152312.1 hypothetical protein [Methanobacterium alcaliphilum]
MISPVLEKDYEWNKRAIGDLFKQLNTLKVEGLSELLTEIKINWESGFYGELLIAFNSTEKMKISRDLTFNELRNNRVMALAEQNLPRGAMDIGLTYIDKFKPMYPFMETVYYMGANRPLEWEDFLNVYFSGLDSRIIFALDNFDEIEFTPQFNARFFRQLGKISLTGRAMELSHKLSRLMKCIGEHISWLNFKDFSQYYCPLEEGFVNFLAACSAMIDKRDTILVEDIIKGYTTFFKIIHSDLMDYKAPGNIIENIPEYKGYLVCEGCSGYYALHPEESPDDFTACQCGGNLLFREKLDTKLTSH